MIRLFTFIITCIFFTCQANSQQLYQQWTTTFGNSAQFQQTNNTLYAGNVVVDENGNSYLYFMDNLNTALVKYNNLGQVVWKVDSLPYVFFPCEDIYAQNSLIYQKGYLYLVSAEGIHKFDLDGGVVWFWNNNSLFGSNNYAEPWMQVDSSDNVTVAWGSSTEQVNIARVNSGSVVWQKYYTLPLYTLNDVQLCLDTSGNSYMSFTGVWPVSDTGNANIIKKFDPSGTELWTVHSTTDQGFYAPKLELQSNGDLWAFSNDSLLVYSYNGSLIHSRGSLHLGFPIYHNDQYHYYSSGQQNPQIIKTDNNVNTINSVGISDNNGFLQGYYSAGHIYMIAANSTTEILELDSNLQINNHLIFETMNGRSAWSTGGTDNTGNFYVFSASIDRDSAELFKFCSGCQPNMRGKFYVDSNQNCNLDSSETGVENTIVSITPGPYYAVTDQQGNYSTLLPPNTYTVTPSRKMYWNASCGDSVVFVLNPSDTLVTVPNFGIYPEKNVCDDGISIWATYANPGYYQNVYVNYENVGTAIDSGFVQVKMDINFIYLSAIPPPDSISGRKLFWHYDSLMQDEGRSIVITDSVPTWVQQFSFYEFTAQIIPFANDTNPGNNYDEVIDEVYSSYDPNEKLCTVKRANSLGYVEDSSLLVYKILFQNTGSDTARRIVVVDTLDNNLDISSLSLLGSSIPGCQLQLINNNIVSFIFKQAMLPDSALNNAGSQGYVSFSIRPMAGLNSGQAISNTATIYFDFNPGVSTNTTNNYYHSPPTNVLQLSGDNLGIKVYPNPTSGRLNVSSTKPSGHPCQIFVYDIAGRSVANFKFDADYNISFNTEPLTNGVYFIAVKEDELILNTVKFIKL